MLRAEEPEEIREGLEDGIEVIGGKIIEVHPELRSCFNSSTSVSTYALDGFNDISDDGESVRPTGTSQISNAYALWSWSASNVNLLNCLYYYVLHLLTCFLLQYYI